MCKQSFILPAEKQRQRARVCMRVCVCVHARGGVKRCLDILFCLPFARSAQYSSSPRFYRLVGIEIRSHNSSTRLYDDGDMIVF